jgi:hypothetical protein
VDLLGGLDAAAAAVGRVSNSGFDSGPSSAAGGAAAAAAAAPVGGLDDLLSSGLLGPTLPAAAAAGPGDLLGMLGESQPAAAGGLVSN